MCASRCVYYFGGGLTSINRIALAVKVDYVHKTIPGLTMAVLYKNGCSLMDQKVFGSFNKLQYWEFNVATYSPKISDRKYFIPN